MDTKKDPFQNLQERMRNALADHSIRAFQELSSSTRDLMSCYRCAIMEIETKFRVLNVFPSSTTATPSTASRAA